MNVQEHLDHALAAYERATFGGADDAVALGDAHLDQVEAALSLARGRLTHARFLDSRQPEPSERELFQRAIQLYAGADDTRGEGEATFWLATYHQVVEGDHHAAEPLLRRAETLAAEAGDDLTHSYVLRHLCFVAQHHGRLDDAQALLEESTGLRRRLGHQAGVAANLIGFAYLAAARDRAEEVPAHLDAAAELAIEAGADGVLGWVDDARADLGLG